MSDEEGADHGSGSNTEQESIHNSGVHSSPYYHPSNSDECASRKSAPTNNDDASTSEERARSSGDKKRVVLHPTQITSDAPVSTIVTNIGMRIVDGINPRNTRRNRNTIATDSSRRPQEPEVSFPRRTNAIGAVRRRSLRRKRRNGTSHLETSPTAHTRRRNGHAIERRTPTITRKLPPEDHPAPHGVPRHQKAIQT